MTNETTQKHAEVKKNRATMTTKKLVLSALFLAVAFVLPFLTGQIKTFGAMLCPMHIPVILCGFICGWQYGLLIGIIAPLMRSFIFGMPVLFPSAVCMSIELCVYGAVAGLMYKLLPKNKWLVYPELIIAMIAGRLVWGLAMFLATGANASTFTFADFLAGSVLNAIPGIIIQILLIPPLVILIKKLSKS